MGNWSYNPTYRRYSPIYNWKGAHLVGAFVLLEIHFKFVLFCFHFDVLFDIDIVGAFFLCSPGGGWFC